MIPSIETIVEDLLEGKITRQQAIGWLYQHAEGAANDLRDHFASLSMHADLSSGESVTAIEVAEAAYKMADAMLAERDK